MNPDTPIAVGLKKVLARVGLIGVLAGGCDKEGEDSGTLATPTTSGTTELAGGAGTSGVDTGGTGGACQGAFQPGTDQPSGLEACPNGAFHSIAMVTCNPSALVPPELEGECSGSCDAFAVAGVCRDHNGPFCHYECATDSDCGDGAACVCATEGLVEFNQCVRAACRTTADCLVPSVCGVSPGACGAPSRLACLPAPGSVEQASGGDVDGLKPCAGPSECSPDELCVFLSAYDGWYCASTNSCGLE